MTAFRVGDIPDEDIVLTPERDGDYIDLAPFDDVTVTLTLDGADVASSGFIGTISNDTIVIEWPAEVVLDEPGLYQVEVTLHGDHARIALDPVPVVVETLNGWQTLAKTRSVWAGAPHDDADLYELLDIAKGQVLDYAPARQDTDPVPASYRRAQLMQARNIWNASSKDSGNQEGGDGFAITVFPLDWTVKNLIRPKKGVPFVA